MPETTRRQKPAAPAAPKGKTLKVTLVRSTIGYDKKQGEIVKGLGLRKIGHTVEVLDHPAMRGMIQKIRHMVTVE
ncbi:50S ribosomal protein L30 [Luteitalea sp. TBR-22]|uniref:50S ribosomal protein L30 n=1 Tax=Luteitalea sp. TBR-22 TaxID=2802971 RepID=UPI001AF5B453|nr:50S ribosomal protein L30 [Luteitalea sp. TBR-22]